MSQNAEAFARVVPIHSVCENGCECEESVDSPMGDLDANLPVGGREFVIPQGMPRSVFENKYARRKPDGTFESWSERVTEVVKGNFTLDPTAPMDDFRRTVELARAGVMPFSGRHLQHGDVHQPEKLGEIYTNCSTAMTSFLKFFLLMKGSGVGRCYDSDMCRVNWDYMPNVRLVLDAPDPVTGVGGHPDYEPWIESLQEARQKYDSESESVRWFKVEDSAEGWTSVVEVLETASWQEKHANKVFIFDFTGVRRSGSPVKGQQNRPADGPVPFMRALLRIMSIKGLGWRPWKQAMYIDHYLSSCISLGKIRSAARIAVKSWRDRDVFDFIDIKRGGFLWTANNSVGLDDEFWDQACHPRPSHGRRVFEAMCAAGYFDRTGEPGWLNLYRMKWKDQGVDDVTVENFLNPRIARALKMHPRTYDMMGSILEYAKRKKYPYICNPCGEIVLAVWGAYCTIGDICLANAESLDEVRDAMRLMPGFLIRTNMMDFLYQAEVNRTNRIGVGITGIHEFAWRHFGFDFNDLLDEEKSKPFWEFLRECQNIVVAAATAYCLERGLSIPHTMLTMKPSGTISKVMACTEGGHLSAFIYYLRWVQFSKGSPELEDHVRRGYPVKDIGGQYHDKVVVGFPTSLPIASLMGENAMCAGDVPPSGHYQWLRLLESYWLGEEHGNQISYTLKYDPAQVSYESFMSFILENQSTVRCCSVMPQEDLSAYAYQPEEAIDRETYLSLISKIDRFEAEKYDADLLSCASGACPTEMDIN